MLQKISLIVCKFILHLHTIQTIYNYYYIYINIIKSPNIYIYIHKNISTIKNMFIMIHWSSTIYLTVNFLHDERSFRRQDHPHPNIYHIYIYIQINIYTQPHLTKTYNEQPVFGPQAQTKSALMFHLLPLCFKRGEFCMFFILSAHMSVCYRI